jgi:hypothetical protein
VALLFPPPAAALALLQLVVELAVFVEADVAAFVELEFDAPIAFSLGGTALMLSLLVSAELRTRLPPAALRLLLLLAAAGPGAGAGPVVRISVLVVHVLCSAAEIADAGATPERAVFPLRRARSRQGARGPRRTARRAQLALPTGRPTR